MNLPYLIPRVARHFLPAGASRFLLRQGWIIRPGLETSNPQAAATRYQEVLAGGGMSLSGKRLMIFGYGGNYAIGCALLEAGALQVVLVDRFAPPDDLRNATLLPLYGAYLVEEGGHVRPRSERLSLLQADIRTIAANRELAPVDVVLSSSVYEHLDDVDGVTGALAALTAPDGAQVHFIDLRDHYFKYPFEMLCYSERAWRSWLNPGSNHNRFRLPDYERVFQRHFTSVSTTVLARDEPAFQRARLRIRPEFLTGDPAIDSATLIQVVVTSPEVRRP